MRMSNNNQRVEITQPGSQRKAYPIYEKRRRNPLGNIPILNTTSIKKVNVSN